MYTHAYISSDLWFDFCIKVFPNIENAIFWTKHGYFSRLWSRRHCLLNRLFSSHKLVYYPSCWSNPKRLSMLVCSSKFWILKWSCALFHSFSTSFSIWPDKLPWMIHFAHGRTRESSKSYFIDLSVHLCCFSIVSPSFFGGELADSAAILCPFLFDEQRPRRSCSCLNCLSIFLCVCVCGWTFLSCRRWVHVLAWHRHAEGLVLQAPVFSVLWKRFVAVVLSVTALPYVWVVKIKPRYDIFVLLTSLVISWLTNHYIKMLFCLVFKIYALALPLAFWPLHYVSHHDFSP